MSPDLEPRSIDHRALAVRLLDENPVLVDKIGKSCEVPLEQIADLLADVLRFMDLVATADEVLSPAPRIDGAWHELILFTRVYGALCESRFGQMIHHTPGGGPETNRRQFRRTLELYQSRFGPPDPRFWGDPATMTSCGGCEAVE